MPTSEPHNFKPCRLIPPPSFVKYHCNSITDVKMMVLNGKIKSCLELVNILDEISSNFKVYTKIV